MPESRDRWQVSHNGVSWSPGDAGRDEWFRRGHPLHILSLSRLVARKNHLQALEAIASLRAQDGVDVRYRIAGTGPMLAELHQTAERLGLTDAVEFLGYVEDDQIPELYRWADVFLHPHTHVGEGNDFEGFGLVIADAMLFGCVCIVGEAGGPRELIEDGVDGALVDGADVAQITDALRRICADGHAAEAMGRAAQVSAQTRFSWDEHVRPALAAFEIDRRPLMRAIS